VGTTCLACLTIIIISLPLPPPSLTPKCHATKPHHIYKYSFSTICHPKVASLTQFVIHKAPPHIQIFILHNLSSKGPIPHTICHPTKPPPCIWVFILHNLSSNNGPPCIRIFILHNLSPKVPIHIEYLLPTIFAWSRGESKGKKRRRKRGGGEGGWLVLLLCGNYGSLAL
jgi:hypothetical protein